MNRARTKCLALLALLPISTACVHDDGFRARLTAGCNTQAACDALYDSAFDRWQACMRSDSIGSGCNDKMQDKDAAGAMRTKAIYDEEKARRDAMDAQNMRAAEDFQKHQAEAPARDKCQAVLRELNVQHVTPPGLSGVADLTYARDAADNEASSQRSAIARLRQCDPVRADQLAPDVETWIAQVDRAITDEETCRKTPACVAPRLVDPLCEALSDRRLAVQGMNRERSNPSGYVDRVALHDFGQEIQNDDDTIRDLKTKYAALTHKPFNDATCPKTP